MFNIISVEFSTKIKNETKEEAEGQTESSVRESIQAKETEIK